MGFFDSEKDVAAYLKMAEGYDGKECFAAMKEIFPDVKAVVASGHAVDGEIGKSIDADVQTFLQKTFEVDDLIDMVQKILSEK